MSYEKQNWVPYDDNLSEEENINVGAVVTAERMNHLESGIQQHTNDEENPHKVTKAQVGLSNVTDVEQASKVDFEAHATNNLNPHGVTASQVGLSNVENIRQAAKTDFDAHVENSSNPHGVTAKQVGLENVMNYGVASQEEAEQGETNERYMTPAQDKQAFDKWLKKWASSQDTGWLEGVTETKFTAYNTGDTPFLYRKKFGLIEIIGTLRTTTELPGNNGDNLCFIMPEGFRPVDTYRKLQQGSNMNKWMLEIGANGYAKVLRYGTTGYQPITTGEWLPFHASYMEKN